MEEEESSLVSDSYWFFLGEVAVVVKVGSIISAEVTGGDQNQVRGQQL